MQYKLYTFLGDFKNATLTAIKMLELLPNNYDWTYALAQSYIKSGEYIAARNVLEKLVSDNGNHPLYLQAMFTLLDVLKKSKLRKQN